MGSTFMVALVSAGVGAVSYALNSDTWQALLMAVLCGVLGGASKVVGVWITQRGMGWWTKRKQKPE